MLGVINTLDEIIHWIIGRNRHILSIVPSVLDLLEML